MDTVGTDHSKNVESSKVSFFSKLCTFLKSLFKLCLNFFLTLLVALCLRSFLFEPFRIPSGSMKSTLLAGDFIVVSKYYYGYSKYSFPFSLPIFKNRIMVYKKPQAGDVIVFRLPRQPHINYIKRVIGLPGDTIQIKSGHVYINGTAMKYDKIDDFVDQDIYGNKKLVPRFKETLYNSKSYEILDEIADSSLDNTPLYEVPEGHFFVLGDNRDNSRDSRFVIDVGYIPFENIVGKAYVVTLSFDSFWPLKIRYDRIWRTIT